DGDFVERIHRHLDVGELDARSVALDADLDVVVDDPLYRHKNLHRSFFRSNLKGNDCSGAEPRAPVPPGQRVRGQKLARKASPGEAPGPPLQRFWPGTQSTSPAPLLLAARLATNRKSDRRFI